VKISGERVAPYMEKALDGFALARALNVPKDLDELREECNDEQREYAPNDPTRNDTEVTKRLQ